MQPPMNKVTKAVKAVRFEHEPSEKLLELMNTFRNMANDAIRIGFEKRPKSRFSLITLAYRELKERYGFHTHYILSACECAFAMLRNRR